MKIKKYSITFLLERRKGKVLNLPINMDVNYQSDKMRYYTGYRVDADKWISEVVREDGTIEKVQRIKKNTVNQDGISAAVINARLTDLESHVNNIFQDFGKNIPSSIQLREELKKRLDETNKPKKEKGFFDYYEQYLIEADVSLLRRKQLRSTMNHFKRFVESKSINITFEKCTPALLMEFERYLDTINPDIIDSKGKKKDKPRSINTISCILSRLRSFFSYALKPERKWIQYSPFSEYSIEEEIYGEPIYLTKEERDNLYNADIPDKRLERVRDLFVLQCLIGARVGDFIKLKKDNIINDTIQYIPAKTKEENQKVVRVPLSDKAKSLIAKYDLPDGALAPYISDQKYNDYIKELFEYVGLKRQVIRLNPLTRENEIVPLYKVASSHMARRTFVGLLHKNIKNEIIASMSGHVENSRAFKRYYKIDNEDLREAIKTIE